VEIFIARGGDKDFSEYPFPLWTPNEPSTTNVEYNQYMNRRKTYRLPWEPYSVRAEHNCVASARGEGLTLKTGENASAEFPTRRTVNGKRIQFFIAILEKR